ncbi:RskA family anti-sigma factor [Nocardia macrotermitis]|uniref:Anti-sigma-K factor RskA N-terminal domain-containing protein n=1 Tax=Nocardia macrotermitis TaxID=2585198 RepID=A0A7K0CZW4_9NOCA|nr:hypothetical protein [Nocardia macrotermitis]MQY19015.1 hypothetical protein [Nocardia macrotermitis]
MNESQIDLAHMVALGSIGDEDQRAVREIAEADDPALRADFDTEVQLNRQALTLFASASATPPPASLRDRVLDMIAAAESESSPAARTPRNAVHPGSPTA